MFETSRKKACSGRGALCRAAPCTRRGRSNVNVNVKSRFPKGCGVGPVAGGAASTPPGPGPAAGGCAFGRLRSGASQAKRPHPCKLGRRIHAAHAPATGPTPPSTVGRDLSERLRVRSVFLRKTDLTPEFHSISDGFDPRMVWMTNRHPETVGGGAVWVGRTVGAMDGAIEPPWMGLRRVLPTHTAPPNSQQTRAALAFDVALACKAGAGLQALPNPHYGRVSRCRAAAWRRRRFDYT